MGGSKKDLVALPASVFVLHVFQEIQVWRGDHPSRIWTTRERQERTVRGRKGKVHYERGSMNVYADLGFRAPEDMLVKAKLVTRISELIAERELTQSKAAVVLGIPQPKLSKMLRGQFRGFSERKLMDCLTRLGQDVDIVVRTTSRAKGQGAVSVSFG